MKREWSEEELSEHWSLLDEELELIAQRSGATRLGFAVLLKFFQNNSYFPESHSEISQLIVEYIAVQIGIPASKWESYDLNERTSRRHRSAIRSYFGFREFIPSDYRQISLFLKKQVFLFDINRTHAIDALYAHFRELKIEPPQRKTIENFVQESVKEFENEFCNNITSRLSEEVKERLDALLLPERKEGIQPEIGRILLSRISTDSGRTSLDTLFEEIYKLKTLRLVGLPGDLFENVSAKNIENYVRQAVVEDAYELKRHPDFIRYTLLASFVYIKSREITDNLVDLLIAVVHRMGTRAEKRVEAEYVSDIKKVAGKNGILFKVADAAIHNPEGTIKEVIFPVVSEKILKALVEEWKSSGAVYQQKVRTIIRQSYSSHYRRALPELLNILQFRSDNEVHHPVIKALNLVKRFIHSKIQTYPVKEEVPIEGVVKSQWRDAVVEEDGEITTVNRISYEICVLQALRDCLRCKEIWVIGANRYRNPEEDLPKDFDERRGIYYKALELPQESKVFIDVIKNTLQASVSELNKSISKNKYVKILEKSGGWIAVSPLPPQPEPENLVELKKEIAGRWPLTSLLDVLKEADLRLQFTDVFKTGSSHERIDRRVLQKRLLLCLYGLGTNAGLKRMSAADPDISYKDLRYTKNRFITKDYLRAAIARVVDATFQERLSFIWGEGTTSCASDSKQFGAWDQNLMTEWHARYGGRGVMIYWHVEKNSTCIYSQLKSCSSSEVASMIEGVLRHCTEMEVAKQYVDSHGQSEVGFAFCHLLGFALMPRLKRIHSQVLYRANTEDQYEHIKHILSRNAINWEIIGQQYDQMVKYATALRLGTAETESILRRFQKGVAVQHPTYKALTELGKAVKTIFLCKYIQHEEIRREIHQGLNVIERWNSVNDFIFYGRGGEFATNDRQDQELTMLSLHLLQTSMVYVNTLMIQQVLQDEKLLKKLEKDDLRALSPLIYAHINPYGFFKLDMNSRLNLTAQDSLIV